MKKTKKEAFFNILLRKLKKLQIPFNTINSSYITITDGLLNGVTFKPCQSRCQVTRIEKSFDKVTISLDLEVNYSFEVFLYKLFKYNMLNESGYVKILKKLQNG